MGWALCSHSVIETVNVDCGARAGNCPREHLIMWGAGTVEPRELNFCTAWISISSSLSVCETVSVLLFFGYSGEILTICSSRPQGGGYGC